MKICEIKLLYTEKQANFVGNNYLANSNNFIIIKHGHGL